MKNTIAICLITLILNLGCKPKAEKENCKINFSGLEFTLPNTVKEIKKSNNLKYQIYRGFRGEFKEYELVIQIKGNPIWTGTENVEEEFYDNESVVGFTFIKDSCLDIQKTIKEVSKLYSISLIKDENKNEYYYAELNNYFIVVYTKLKCCYISFYNGLYKKDIQTYIEGVF